MLSFSNRVPCEWPESKRKTEMTGKRLCLEIRNMKDVVQVCRWSGVGP